MCGRFVITAPREAIEALFDVDIDSRYEPLYNIAPSQPVMHVHTFGGGPRRVDYARWGLIPAWHKAPQSAQPMINARSETVIEKPSFRAAVRHRRVLVPATHFYEWKREGQIKQPYAVNRKVPDGSAGLFAMAGIVEEWTSANGDILPTLAILTQDADGDIAAIHHRMPIVVPPEHYAHWLDCQRVDPQGALQPLRIPRPNAWRPWPVDVAVNKASEDGPDLLREVQPPAPEPPKSNPQLDLF